MAPERQWVAFDDNEEDDEKLSLCDLPVVAVDKEKNDTIGAADDAADDDDFEFLTCIRGGRPSTAADADMCAADEVFFQGQILPLRPSVSSDCGLLGPSRCGSRSDSMDGCSSAVASLGFTSSRSSSISSRSSGCISRSHSSNSSDPPRLSVSNNFYAHPSPSPQVRHAVRRSSAGRRSTGSSPPGWELLRLGLVKAPEIELYSLKSRRPTDCGNAYKRNTHDTKHENRVTENRVMRFLGRGFGCKCSPDAINGAREGVSIARKKTVERSRSERGASMRHGGGRIIEWLEELSVTKASMV